MRRRQPQLLFLSGFSLPLDTMKETEIIEKFFAGLGGEGLAAPGDDAALLTPPAGKSLVTSVDSSLVGRHFPPDLAPVDIGWRSLAVALSDLAACGAEADFCLLALALPEVDANWLRAFSSGFGDCANRYGVRLVGGDLVRGDLSVTVQVGGWVGDGEFLTRSGAAAGDLLCVTGEVGAAAVGLQLCLGEPVPEMSAELEADYRRAWLQPEPKLAIGRKLVGLASACIDVSDGLALDASRLCAASGVGADLESDGVPACPVGTFDVAVERALRGGDDYELCFSVAPGKRQLLQQRLGAEGKLWNQIGILEEEPGLRLDALPYVVGGWDHF